MTGINLILQYNRPACVWTEISSKKKANTSTGNLPRLRFHKSKFKSIEKMILKQDWLNVALHQTLTWNLNILYPQWKSDLSQSAKPTTTTRTRSLGRRKCVWDSEQRNRHLKTNEKSCLKSTRMETEKTASILWKGENREYKVKLCHRNDLSGFQIGRLCHRKPNEDKENIKRTVQKCSHHSLVEFIASSPVT